MLLTLVLNLVLFGPTFETPINTEEALAQGIIFHKEGKILITEKFIINAEFLVPFPRYNFTVPQIETLLLELSKKWITQSEFCNMTHSTTYRNQTDVFNVDWLYSKILNETIEVEIEVFKLCNETEKLLTIKTQYCQVYVDNDKKTKIALLLQSTASKILSFYSPPDPIIATYTPYNPSASPPLAL